MFLILLEWTLLDRTTAVKKVFPQRVRHASPELIRFAQHHRRQPTPAEAILWEALRGKQLQGVRFRRQHPVETFIFDFYCPIHKLVLEVDGTSHDSPRAHESDTERDAWVQAHGYRVLRLRNEEILGNLPAVLERIQSAIAQPSGLESAP